MSIVQVVNKNLTTGGTTQTTAAIATTPGNTLVFCAVYNSTNAGAVTPTDSTSQVWKPAPKSPYAGSASGLSLGVWVASNIAGNAANTFTFATTGSDTPTIFIAEFSGRDKISPVDITVTASDTTAASGSHTTGSITLKTSSDDLLSFIVATALAQTFSAGGSWNIPPNGTVTTGAGYDAFVQYQNAVAAGTISNTYSVSLSDKLDAFIISLQVPGQPYSDEYGGWFDEVPEVVGFTNSYQTQDVQPQIADIDIDWLAEAGDNEAWTGVEDQSRPVVPDATSNTAIQYFGTDAEFYDEVLEGVVSPATYQTSTIAQQIDDFVDWDEDPDDFFADDFGNDDADLPVADPWDWTQSDDTVLVASSYQQFDAIGPTPITVEDPWDPVFWGEEPDQIDGTTTDLDAVGPDNNPIIAPADAFERVFDDVAEATDDSWWIALAGDYAYVDVVPVDRITTEDGYDHWSQDADDETFLVLDTDSTYSNTTQLPEDAFDHFPNDGDDYVVSEDYQQPPDILAIGDTIDWTQDSDDDQFLTQGTDPVIPVPPQSPEDPVDHWLTDPDDELFFVLNSDPVIPVPPQAIGDELDWTQDSDDEEWIARNADPVGEDAPAVLQTDWDWTQDDDDQGPLNDQLSASIVVTPSQFTDFAWDFGTDDDVVDTWTDWGEITPVGEDRFGYCLVEAVSQTGIQGARSAFLENAACLVIASYFDSNGLPFVPNVIEYRVDDEESETNLLPWTQLPLATVSTVIITPLENRMVSFTRPFEVHQVLFQITDRAGDINYARVKFDVIRVTGA